MLRFTKHFALACGLLLSLSAQATTYTAISGATFDLYYDAAVLGNNVSLSGNSLTIKLAEGTQGFTLDANSPDSPLVLVPHAGYALSHYLPTYPSATAYAGALGGENVLGYTALFGGSFNAGVFQSQSFVAETYTYGSRQYFLGDDPQNHLVQSSDGHHYDMDPGANYAAYAVNFEASLGVSWNGDAVPVYSPTVALNFSLTGVPAAPVPEPGTWLMLLGGLALVARRVKAAAA